MLYRSLYRRSLKLSLDWAVHRQIWRGQAVYIRSLFEANKDVRDPRQQQVRKSQVTQLPAYSNTLPLQVLLRETEKLLETWKHPDPYRAPTAPGGNKWERNLPARILPCKLKSIVHFRALLTQNFFFYRCATPWCSLN
jgi:NADH dehydrogenase (ubiquinone) 1 beta subcomplex subunit 9